MSIQHEANILSTTRCGNIDDHIKKGDEVPPVATAIPREITDRDLNDNGVYTFEKLMKFRYPEDFAGLRRSSEHQGGKNDKDNHETLVTTVFINLSRNFDITASIDAEFDRSLFSMALTEVT
jgi:hypothetical protein